MTIATGQAIIPTLEPGKAVNIVVKLDRELKPPNKYDISVLRSAAIELAGATVKVTEHTPTTVTIRVMAEHGLAGAGAVFILCS